MIGVHHHDRREPTVGEPIEQLVVYARGDHDRQPRMDAQTLYMIDRRDLCDQRRQSTIDQHQRIAAAQDHFVNRRVGGDACQRVPPCGVAVRRLFVRKMAAEAIAAVNRAGAGRDQQRAARVLLQHARMQGRSAVCYRIGSVAVDDICLRTNGQHLPQHRIGRIAPTDTRQITGRHEDRKTGRSALRSSCQFRRQFQAPAQLIRTCAPPDAIRPAKQARLNRGGQAPPLSLKYSLADTHV